MKIAVLSDQFSSGPGGQHRIQNIAMGFSKLGHDVIYLSPYGMSKSLLEMDLSHANARKMAGPGKYLYPYFNDFFGIFKKLVKLDMKLDLVVISLPNTMSKSLNGIIGLSRKMQISYDFGGLWTSILDQGKIYGQNSLQFRLIRPVSQLWEDSLAVLSSKLPDIVTVPTTGMHQLLEKFFGRRTHVVYQPVDTSIAFNPSLIDYQKSLKNIPDKYRNARIVVVGVKGDEWFVPMLETLIKKCKGYDAVFMVIGHFPKAETLISKKNLGDKVFFTGNVPYNILPSYLKQAKFAVVLAHPDLAAIWYSPHNIAKIVDYMAMGKPVVTDTPSAFDYVENGETGFLVKTEEGLINKTLNLLDDNVLLEKMAEVARKKACEKFDYIKVADHYLKLVKSNVYRV